MEALYCNGWPMDCGAVPIAETHALVLDGAGQQLAVAWHDESGRSNGRSGPAQPWLSGDRPPYYERWGDLYDQWPGETGWSTASGAHLWRSEEEIRWVWRSGHTDPADILEGHRAVLRLRFDEDREALSSWVRACRRPLEPRLTDADFPLSSAVKRVCRLPNAVISISRYPPIGEWRRSARVCRYGTGFCEVLHVADFRSSDDFAMELRRL